MGKRVLEWVDTPMRDLVVNKEIDEDGFEIINPSQPQAKGIKCGVCGMKFEYNKSYGIVCSREGCPIFMQVTC